MNITEITPKKQQTNGPIRLAAYCRVSSDSADQLHSFAAQIKYYMDYTRTHPEYTLIDIYADEGLTGTDKEKRDELNRLLRDCRQGKIDRIIVKAVSRFARNTTELLQMLRMLRDLGVSVYFEEQGIDSEKMNMEMIVTFPGMAAQQESETISQNMRWSYKKRMESGDFNCCTPAYGYNMIDGELIINEAEAAVVRRIFSMYMQGIGKRAIAKCLNDEGVPLRYGRKQWYHTTIKYILSNERYKGDALLQKFYTTDTLPYRKKENRGEKTQYYIENASSAIIDNELFDAVQEQLKIRETNKKFALEPFPLRKILRCPECGRVFRRQITNGISYWVPSCRTSGQTQCQNRRLKEEAVYDAFIIMIYKLKDHRQELLEKLIDQLKTMQERSSASYGDVKRIDKAIADLSAQNLVLARLHNNGIMTAVEYAERSTEINRKLTSLRVERRNVLNNDEDSELLDDLYELNALLADYVPNGDFDDDLFSQIVKSITVIDNAHLRFTLAGGIICEETIQEKGRCRSA